MRVAFIAVAFSVLTAGCLTPCPSTPQVSTTLLYHCDDGSDLQVTFNHQPDSAHVVQEGYAPIDLPSRITGSGYRYSSEGSELRGRGEDARWQRPGAAETICRQTP